MNIILLGAPGAGKGVQSKAIAEHFNIPIVSSGDILREFAKKQSTDSKLNGEMQGGQLISDEFVMELIFNELKSNKYTNGYILEGVPRTLVQAEAIEKHNINIAAVIYINVPEDIVKERVLHRKVCKSCGKIYNEEGKTICAQCGGELFKRNDDNEEAIKERLNVYHKKTEALIEYYRAKNLLKEINGNQQISNVSKEMFGVLESL